MKGSLIRNLTELARGFFSRNLFRILLMSVILFSTSYASLQKDYQLIYFRYQPLDIIVEISTLNDGGKLGNTDYIMSKIDTNTGDARLFLVKDSPYERDKKATYEYRVSFFKMQTIEFERYKVPIYSFVISFVGEQVRIRYENVKFAQTFNKSLDSQIYYIKDENGSDFNLAERMRTVKFLGLVNQINIEDILAPKVAAKIPEKKTTEKKDTKKKDTKKKDNKKTVKKPVAKPTVVKKAPEVYTDIRSERRVMLRLTPKDNFGATNYYIDVPLNQEIVVGHSPYYIRNADADERYQLKYIMVGGKKSTNLVVHFGEVWDNMYEQQLLFEDNGKHIDFYFNSKLFDVMYSIGNNRIMKQESSPFSLSLKECEGKDVRVGLSAKDIAIKYTSKPSDVVYFTVKKGASYNDVMRNIVLSNRTLTRITEDGSVYLEPKFFTTPFAILSTPENAKISYKKLEPIGDKSDGDLIDLGESPVFFKNLEYGKYLFIAQWFAVETNRGVTEVVSRRSESVVEFSSYSTTITMDNAKSELQYLSHQNTKIPYIMFTYGKNLTERVVRSEDKKIEDARRDKTFELVEKLYDEEDFELNIDIEETAVRKIDIPERRPPKTYNYIPNVPQYYVQIAAFERYDRQLNKRIEDFIESYRKSYIKQYGNAPGPCGLAIKTLNKKDYVVIIRGPYSYDGARLEMDRIRRVIKSAFMVNGADVSEFRP